MPFKWYKPKDYKKALQIHDLQGFFFVDCHYLRWSRRLVSERA